MGSKIKAKYDGGCKICGGSWNIGRSEDHTLPIYYINLFAII